MMAYTKEKTCAGVRVESADVDRAGWKATKDGVGRERKIINMNSVAGDSSE